MTAGDAARGDTAADAAPVAKVRLFAAVEVPGNVATAVAAAVEPLRRASPAVRWTSPESWHLTLTFLGWVPEDRIGGVRAVLAEAAAAAAPFELELTGRAGSFRGGVVWAGLRPEPALARLAEDATARLSGVVGLPDAGRPFRPHLTLGRAKGRPAEARAAADAYDGPRTAWRVERVALVRSHLSQAGARYERLGTWRLGEDA